MDKKQLLINLATSFVGAFLAIGLYTALMGGPVVQPPQPMMPQMGGPMMPGAPMPSQMQPPMPPGQPNPAMMQGRPPMPPQAGQPGAKPMPMPAQKVKK